MTKSFLAFVACTAVAGVLSAQQDVTIPCLHNDMELLAPLHGYEPAALEQIAAAEAELEAFTEAFSTTRSDREDPEYIIPVVFHIVHNNGTENITDAQVLDAMRVLNDDFRRLNSDWDNVHSSYLDIVADVGVEFRLAQKDPQGICHTGITRTVSTLTNSGDQAMKNLIQWPRNKYLNVWVSASAGGAAGYTYRPGSVSQYPAGDGIVLLHSYVGTIGTGSVGRSRTLTHEVGHWINLAHTWGNSNNPGLAENCSDDDNVADTPNTIGWTSCSINGSSCGTPDNVENYMEYSYCSKMFTEGQAARMIAALNSNVSQRNQLWLATNLAATGAVGESQLCAAQFTGNGGVICAGQSVTYHDQSFHSVTSRSWEFPGGTPSTSTDTDPVVTYTEAGVYPVTLTVSDGNATLTTTETSFVTVLPVPGNAAPFYDSFEEVSDLDNEMWTVNDLNGGNTFAITNAVAYSGQRSVRLLNNASYSGQVDELYSGTFDMSEVENITISFRYAYARRSSLNDDRLRVYVSHNCGEHWSLRKQIRGSQDLPTAPNTNANFVPTGLDQWGYAVVDNISPLNFVSDFRFMFSFEGDSGNNLYIDDININGYPVSVEDLGLVANTGLLVVPNPAADQADLVFSMNDAVSARLALVDVLGREVEVLHDGTLAAGPHRMQLPIGDLNSGIYFIRMHRDGLSEVIRFVVK